MTEDAQTVRPLTWITRNASDDICQTIRNAIKNKDRTSMVIRVRASAGIGKTMLARDVGGRLGGASSDEPQCTDDVAWSGLLDVYDPDTNSNRGFERRLQRAFSPDGYEFEDYFAAQELYDVQSKTGALGMSMEEQRHKVETSFADALRTLSAGRRLVITVDTIERLERAADPTQDEPLTYEDTTSLPGWLLFQITQLRNTTVLLLGRRTDGFDRALEHAIVTANEKRLDDPIMLQTIALGRFSSDEQRRFFDQRTGDYPELAMLLDDELKGQMVERSRGNPLSLDLALQLLLATRRPETLKRFLQREFGPQALKRELLHEYMNEASPKRQIVLHWLAVARNGLSEGLLRHFEGENAGALMAELRRMESLPFMKMRDLVVPGLADEAPRRTYFMHDTMYTVCDEVLLRPPSVASQSLGIVEWYDQQVQALRSIKEARRPGTARKADPRHQWWVESLFYRMRANPVDGFRWYLQHSDQAIRGGQTSLDMRLRDAMGLFLASASHAPDPELEQGESLASVLDQANVDASMPDLVEEFRLENATLWVKRYTVRGRHDLAQAVVKRMLPVVQVAYQRDPERYRLMMAEFLLFDGQSTMYGYDAARAERIYHQVFEVLGLDVTDPSAGLAATEVTLDPHARWRLHFIVGRTSNNLGYLHWMYDGKLGLAIEEFRRAIKLFRTARPDLAEELANSRDNLGRVYAQLGNESEAIQLIKQGLETRRALDQSYRIALSNASLAIAYNSFEKTDQALTVANDAVRLFRLANVLRGLGLGWLARGLVYRTMAESWREQNIALSQALRYTDDGETDLQEAVRIFTQSVREPIREVRVLNELACCYRARYLLALNDETSSIDPDLSFTRARVYFRQAIELAREKGYAMEELDSLQDIAVLFARAERWDETERYLAELVSRVPDRYKVQMGVGLAHIPPAECRDSYYKLMGQAELLLGYVVYRHGQTKSGITSDMATLETMRHYLLAVAYLCRYSGESYARQEVYQRMSNRFETCSSELEREITGRYVPQWIADYQLPVTLVDQLIDDTFGAFGDITV